MRIIPIQPQPDHPSEHDGQSLNTLTFDNRRPASRRTFGYRGPSRRTFGYRGPSRRTFAIRGNG